MVMAFEVEMVFEIPMSGRAKNALDEETMGSILEKLHQAAGRPVLLTGSAGSFSSGLNLKVVSGLSETEMRSFLERLEHFMCALYLYPGPTAAAIQGHAIAGGCVMALCCDYRVVTASPDIKIGLNEVALGVQFPPRISTIVRRRIPQRHLERVLLGAELVDPLRALDLGLVDAVAEDPVADARSKLSLWGSYSPEAFAATKRDLRGREPSCLVSDVEEQKLLDDALGSWLRPEVKARMLCALAKRSP